MVSFLSVLVFVKHLSVISNDEISNDCFGETVVITRQIFEESPFHNFLS